MLHFDNALRGQKAGVRPAHHERCGHRPRRGYSHNHPRVRPYDALRAYNAAEPFGGGV